MSIFPVGFSQPSVCCPGLQNWLPLSRTLAHLNPDLSLGGLPAWADIPGSERRNDPPGSLQNLCQERKGEKKKKSQGLGPESSVTEILIQLFSSLAQLPFSTPCKGCMFCMRTCLSTYDP